MHSWRSWAYASETRMAVSIAGAYRLGQEHSIQHMLNGVAGNEVCERHCGRLAARGGDGQRVQAHLQNAMAPSCLVHCLKRRARCSASMPGQQLGNGRPDWQLFKLSGNGGLIGPA